MTDKLRETLHDQAERAGMPPVDLDSIVGGGRRSVRRRRAAGATAGVAGLAAAVALAVTLTAPDPRRAEPEPVDGFPVGLRSSEPVYTVGSTLVDGDRTVELARPVDRLVQTLDGYVYVSDGQVAAWVDGREVDLGTTTPATTQNYPLGLLQADHDGHAAAWIEPGDDEPTLVVVDTRTLETRRLALEAPAPGEPLRLHDVDGSTAYLADGRGEATVDLVSGEHRPLEVAVVDAEGGVVAGVATASPDNGIVLTGPAGTAVLGYDSAVLLSPDGRWVATHAIVGSVSPRGNSGGGASASPTGLGVYDSVDDRVVDLELRTAYIGATRSPRFSGWLDTDTVAIAFVTPRGAGAVFGCTVPSGRCREVARDLPNGAVVWGSTF